MTSNGRGRLSAFRVQQLIREGKPGHYADGGGLGLYLRVSGPGKASWSMRYKVGGTLREMGLGPASVFGLAEARDRAVAARKLLLDGQDPIQARREARAEAEVEAARAVTFRQAAEQYIAAHSGWSDKHRANFESAMVRLVYPRIGDMQVSAIDTAAVIRVLEPIWSTTRETATRLSAWLAGVLDWAKVRGLRDGDNPAARSLMRFVIPKRSEPVASFSALPAAELPALMGELGEIGGVASRALRFLILTAARTGEVLGATWDEIDVDAAIWVIPAARMKMAKEHRVPLSAPALDVLRECAAVRESQRIFPGLHWSPDPLGARIHQGVMLALLKALRPGATVHGFRSTFSTWAAEGGWPYEIREASLAHAVGPDIERRYQRSVFFDQRRRLMDAWAAHCLGTGSPADVIPLRR